MNSLLEISTPLSTIEKGRKNQITSDKFQNLSKFKYNQNKLSTGLLTNTSRLQEIYDLRLAIWEHYGKIEFINRKLFPNGWHDELDETAFHWITLNDQNKIVAAARLNIFHSLEESPYFHSFKHLTFPPGSAFAFYSRLVVNPQYRHNGLSKQLYDGRAQFSKEKKIAWSQVFINNPYIIGLFETEGFNNIGQAEVSYHSSSQPHSINIFVKENNYG